MPLEGTSWRAVDWEHPVTRCHRHPRARGLGLPAENPIRIRTRYADQVSDSNCPFLVRLAPVSKVDLPLNG
eukprot:COSAG06_NODE_173_length_21283_cov_14.116220_2_plen_71_part_00